MNTGLRTTPRKTVYYVSNYEPTVNTAGLVSKTYSGADGAAILSNTAATDYDCQLPFGLDLLNASFFLEVRQKITLQWMLSTSVHGATIRNLNGDVDSVGSYTTDYGMGFADSGTTRGVIRVHFGAFGYITYAGASSSWATVAGLFDRWRVKVVL